MSGVGTLATWVALAAGVAILATGAAEVLSKHLPIGRDRRLRRTPPVGRALFGVFVLTETIPRLAGAPTTALLALSIAALIPLAGCVIIESRRHHPAPSRPSDR